MSGPDDVTVVWLAEGEVRDDTTRALAEWARARGLRLSPAKEAEDAPSLGVDLAVSDRIEKELERANEAIAAHDADLAERALARAEAALRAHPELPQAAWLRAEVHRAWAARFQRLPPQDEARARAAWQAAAALDGGRAAGVGEAPAPAPEAGRAVIVVHGAAGRSVTLRLDGRPLEGRREGEALRVETSVAPGEHQLVATVDDQPVFASWVAIAGSPDAPARVDVHLPSGDACTPAAFASVARDDGRIRAEGVACDRWIAAIPLERPGALLVARCERGACGPLVEWRTERLGVGPPQPPPPPSRWPAWATWTLVGFGAATATTIGLVASGVLEPRATEPRFVAGGVRNE